MTESQTYIRHIRNLLGQYYDGTVSDSGMRELQEFFISTDMESLPDDMKPDALMFGTLHSGTTTAAPPESLAADIMDAVDKHDMDRRRKPKLWWMLSAAAAAAVALLLTIPAVRYDYTPEHLPIVALETQAVQDTEVVTPPVDTVHIVPEANTPAEPARNRHFRHPKKQNARTGIAQNMAADQATPQNYTVEIKSPDKAEKVVTRVLNVIASSGKASRTGIIYASRQIDEVEMLLTENH